MRKPKVGDTIVIIKKSGDHNYQLGKSYEICNIVNVESTIPYFVAKDPTTDFVGNYLIEENFNIVRRRAEVGNVIELIEDYKNLKKGNRYDVISASENDVCVVSDIGIKMIVPNYYCDVVENPDEEKKPKPKFKIGDTVTFLSKAESSKIRGASTKSYYFGGEELGKTKAIVTGIKAYYNDNKCFEIIVIFKSPISNSETTFAMLECEFEEYHKSTVKPEPLTAVRTFLGTREEETYKMTFLGTKEESFNINDSKSQKTKKDHETFRLPKSIIRGQEIQGNSTSSRTTPASVASGHLGHRACSAFQK